MTRPPLSLLAQKALLAAVALYRLAARPLLPRSCRFAPSCSEFARQALIAHGPWRGLGLSLARLLRCHPFNPGGYDPVHG